MSHFVEKYAKRKKQHKWGFLANNQICTNSISSTKMINFVDFVPCMNLNEVEQEENKSSKTTWNLRENMLKINEGVKYCIQLMNAEHTT